MKSNKVTMKDVAKAAKVSVASVSYVINGIDKVTAETKANILKHIEELGYRPNVMARNLKKQESHIIAVLIPIKEDYKKTILTDNPFYQDFISGVEYQAREHGYSTLIIGNQDEEDCIQFIRSHAFAGVIVVGNISPRITDSLELLEIPVIVLDNQKTSEKFCYLLTDDYDGAFKAVDFLANEGHTSIGFVCGAIEDSIVHKNRFAGYKDALTKHKLALNEKLVFETAVSYEGGIEVSHKIVEYLDQMTAVFVASDIAALGLIKGLHRLDKRVPRDLSIVGFDDIKLGRYFIPELTTIRQDIFHKGATGVELILYNTKEKTNPILEKVIDVDLIVRESVKNLNE